MRTNIGDDAQKICPWIPKPCIIHTAMICDDGESYIFHLIRRTPLETEHILVPRYDDEKFLSQATSLAEEGVVAWMEVVKCATTQHAP